MCRYKLIMLCNFNCFDILLIKIESACLRRAEFYERMLPDQVITLEAKNELW